MIVMKFGGTSVADAETMRTMCSIVRSRQQRHPIVVLSASAGVTNALIDCARIAAEGRESEAQGRLKSEVVGRHYDIIQGLINGLREQDALIREFSRYFDELQHLLYGLSITGDLSPRVLDFFVAYGERMSTAIAAVAMTEMGVPAQLVDSRGFIITNSDFGRAEPDFVATAEKTTGILGPIVRKRRVPVIQGFIAADHRGLTTTLGRGGSDYTAAIVGATLHAEAIEIWTDVDGILTADPKLVPHARRVDEMSFKEASELAYFGAKVLHPSTLLPAIEKNIPVYIFNTLNPGNNGTAIRASIPPSNSVVKSISYKRGITVLNIASTRMLGSYGFMKKMFDIFNDHQTSVDLVTTSEVSVSLSIDSTPDLDRLVEDLSHYGHVTVNPRMAIVCIIGENIRRERGLAARIFGRLSEIPVDMISQGSSDINLTFVIEEQYIPQAITSLHEEFFPAS